VIHSLSQEILNFSMYMLGCKVALEQDLSIVAIFRRKKYLDVPVILGSCTAVPDQTACSYRYESYTCRSRLALMTRIALLYCTVGQGKINA
jgi:hypothetical protein